MKKNSIDLFLYLIFFVLKAHCVQPLERNPFEFKQETTIQNSTPQKKFETLSKWNIKENGDELIIVENIDDGQIRTIEIAPSVH